MPRLLLPSLIALLAALWPAAGTAGEVIAHPSVSLGHDEVRDVFLGEKQFAGTLRLVPVDNAAAQESFLSHVLQTDLRKYAARWVKKTFREGMAPPAVKGSDAEVIAFVRANPGAVGYIAGSSRGAGVKLVQEF